MTTKDKLKHFFYDYQDLIKRLDEKMIASLTRAHKEVLFIEIIGDKMEVLDLEINGELEKIVKDEILKMMEAAIIRIITKQKKDEKKHCQRCQSLIRLCMEYDVPLSEIRKNIDCLD